jgi:pantoate--beta-alanine ligase
MILVTEPQEMQRLAEDARRGGKEIAFVPTMGALHAGHLTLIRGALEYGDLVVTSVFVNPAQFGKGEDFTRYPRDLDRDGLLAADAGSDVLFAPSAGAMYPAGYATFVDLEGVTSMLEGKARPGHFKGVATVVAKLANIVRPHVMLLGQKDAQQVVVIRRMLADMNTGVKVVVVPTVRESDGLAMSSRNAYLSASERAQAPVLHRALQAVEQRVRAGERHGDVLHALMVSTIGTSDLAVIDYVSVADAGSLQELTTLSPGMAVLVSLAVRFGSTRLIDNCTFTV